MILASPCTAPSSSACQGRRRRPSARRSSSPEQVNPHTIQVSVAAPYPGTELYRQAIANGWLPAEDDGSALVSEDGTQLSPLSYADLSHSEILDSVDSFYRRYYFRAGKLAEMSAELARHPQTAARRLREGAEFVQFLGRRRRPSAAT